MKDFRWYREIDIEDTENNGDKVTQGDIILNCPVVKMEQTESYPFFSTVGAEITAVVMTQACDLENRKPKVKEITVCPITTLKFVVDGIMSKKFNGMQPGKDFEKNKAGVVEEIRRGNYLDFHLINKYESGTDLDLPYSIVHLKNQYRIPVNAIQRIVHERGGKRLRLLPPYRESLAQAYTFNFNRIGLPIDIEVDMQEV